MPTKLSKPDAHTRDANSEGLGALAHVERQPEAPSSIKNFEADLVLSSVQGHFGPSAAGMAVHI